jgi:hypothetical protein
MLVFYAARRRRRHTPATANLSSTKVAGSGTEEFAWSDGVEVGGEEPQRLGVTSQNGGQAVAGRYQRVPVGKSGAIRLT